MPRRAAHEGKVAWRDRRVNILPEAINGNRRQFKVQGSKFKACRCCFSPSPSSAFSVFLAVNGGFKACPHPAGRHRDLGVAAFHPAACRGLVSVVRFPGLALPLSFLGQSSLGVNLDNLRNLRPLGRFRCSLFTLHSALLTLHSKMSVCAFNHTKEGHLCAS
jgi:hypothetical protein